MVQHKIEATAEKFHNSSPEGPPVKVYVYVVVAIRGWERDPHLQDSSYRTEWGIWLSNRIGHVALQRCSQEIALTVP